MRSKGVPPDVKGQCDQINELKGNPHSADCPISNHHLCIAYTAVMEVQPVELIHGKRYTIKCFDEMGSRVVVELSGVFVTSYLFGSDGMLRGAVDIDLIDTRGGHRYIFENIKFKRGSGANVREFFTQRGEFMTSFFQVPYVRNSPLATPEFEATNPRRENVMICSDTHIYFQTEDQTRLHLATAIGPRPMRFYDDFVRKILQKKHTTRSHKNSRGYLPALDPSSIEHIESYLYKRGGTKRRRHKY